MFVVRIRKKFLRLEPEYTVKEKSTNLRHMSAVYGGEITRNSGEEICYYPGSTQAGEGFIYHHSINLFSFCYGVLYHDLILPLSC